MQKLVAEDCTRGELDGTLTRDEDGYWKPFRHFRKAHHLTQLRGLAAAYYGYVCSSFGHILGGMPAEQLLACLDHLSIDTEAFDNGYKLVYGRV